MARPKEEPPAFSVKQHPEVRHVFAHLISAIEYLCEGERAAAQYCIDEIKGLTHFTGGIEDFPQYCRRKWRDNPAKGGDRRGEERQRQQKETVPLLRRAKKVGARRG